MGIIGPSSTPPTRPSSTSIPTRNNIHGSSPRLRSDTLTAAEKTSFFGSGGGSSRGLENNARQYTIMPKKKYVSEILTLRVRMRIWEFVRMHGRTQFFAEYILYLFTHHTH